jgi:hypothetical protein
MGDYLMESNASGENDLMARPEACCNSVGPEAVDDGEREFDDGHLEEGADASGV